MKTFDKLEESVFDKHGNFYIDADKRMFMVLCEEIDRLNARLDQLILAELNRPISNNP